MNSSFSGLRALATFAVLVPLAIVIGYFLANPLDYSTIGIIGAVLFVLAFPLLLKWHQPMLLLSWNMAFIIPFVKGQPNLWLLMSALALGIAIFERALNREMRFVQVPSVTLPLFAIVAVTLITAKLTGGLGFRAFGSEIYGGKKYVFLLAAIAAYFALTAWRIPPEKAKLYTSLFFLGGLVGIIGDFYAITPQSLGFIFWFVPPARIETVFGFEFGVTRLVGVSVAAQMLLHVMLLRHGVRGIFLSSKIWRPLAFVLLFGISLIGGFRSMLLSIALVFCIQFILEGLHRSRLLPVFVFGTILCAAIIIPFASKLPYTIQRSLAIFPLELDSRAVFDAQDSTKWRLDMWAALLPQVPKYFWLGKGYGITQEDYQMMGHDTSFKSFDASQQGLALAGDYHSGPLSIILPFGVWGGLAFVWFISAAIRVLYRNYRYGPPELKLINSVLFSLFLSRLIMFTFVVGALQSDMWAFVGFLGLSVSLNNGMAKKTVVEPSAVAERSSPRLLHPRPSFQR